MAYTQPTDKPASKKNKLINISLVGIMRGALGLPIEHPFQTIKTWMQAENQSVTQALTHIYKKKGLKGYYAGFGINLIRVVSKSAYRWPLTIYLLDLFRRIGHKQGWSMGRAGATAGIVTAMVESIIICPLQRLKVWLMTSYSHIRYINFVKLQTFRSLFDGFRPVLLKQVLSWTSFLGSQQYFKDMVYKYIQKDPRQHELTTPQLMLISQMVCFVNTMIVMPSDYIKTHYQKFGSGQVPQLSLTRFAVRCYKQIGLLGFYRGGTVKIIHYNINAMLTIPLLEKLLRRYQQ